MDNQLYPKSVIDKFMNENLLFKDEKLKKYGEFLNVTCLIDAHSIDYHSVSTD